MKRANEAKTAPNIIKALIKTLYDEEYGLQNGQNRTDIDVFGHDQLEHVVDEFWAAGASEGEEGSVPMSSTGRVNRLLNQQVRANTRTFTNIMGGVTNRLEYITEDARLRRIFDNTENQFDFRDLLDENTVILFDLGDLRSDSATVMTGVILTSLHEVLKERKAELQEKPDDYVVNLQIDEAASVTVSGIMNTLLEKGRSFRLSVGMLMQFPKQIEEEGGRKVYLNTLNDIGTLIIGKIAIDRDIARVMANDDTSPEEFENRISALPPGEWVIQTQSPEFGETGPTPFSLKPLPIPPGHPESDQPLNDDEEAEFQDALETVHEKTRDQFGVPETESDASQSHPATQHEQPRPGGDDDMQALDQHLAAAVRTVQLQEDGREDNEWVGVPAVTNLLVDRLEDTDLVCPHDALGDLREHSPLVTVEYDAATDESVIRLTEEGEEAAQPETGDVRSAGSEAHDDALLAIESVLSPLEFTVEIVEQDGSEQPDAMATHPDLDVEFHIEVETTTPENPVKVLENLKKAQAADCVPLFVVEPKDEDYTYWAKRVEHILSPPVKQLENGETQYYTTDEAITFNGGATADGGVTAVRPVNGTDDSRRSVWVRDDDSHCLQDSTGTKYATLSDVATASRDEFPAIYSYDPTEGTYTVYEHGETSVYETRDGFESDWVPIKRPFVPGTELPVPEYTDDTYAIVILPEDSESEAAHYTEATTVPPDTLVENAPHPARTTPTGSARSGDDDTDPTVNPNDEDPAETTATPDQPDSEPIRETGDAVTPNDSDSERDGNDRAHLSAPAGDPDDGVAAFAATHLVEADDNVVSVADVYSPYAEYASTHRFPVRNRSQFTRTLKNYVSLETGQRRLNGSPTRVYIGIALTDGETIGTEDAEELPDSDDPVDDA